MSVNPTSLHSLPKPGPAVSSSSASSHKPPSSLQKSPASSENSPGPQESGGGEHKFQLDAQTAAAIGDLMDQRLQQFAGLVGVMEGLKPKPTKHSKVPAANSSSKSILGSLRSHYGGASATSSSRPPASSTFSHDAESDGGDVDGDGGDVKEEAAQPERYATVVLANAQTAGSVLNWVKAQTWNHSRSMHECVAIAAAIDAFLAEGVGDGSEGMEILCRRLSGVHSADKFNNWDMCKVVEYPYASETLLDQRLLSRAVKDASARARLLNRASKSSSSKHRPYGGGSNNNNSNKTSSTFKSKFGVGSGSAGASRH